MDQVNNYIIEHAEKAGVKFVYGCEITGAVVFGNRVAGIKTAAGEIYADLVIDAAGMNSPVRKSLPHWLGVQNSSIEYEQFYVYRAFWNRPIL